MPKSSVMRFESSAEMSHSLAAGWSLVLDQATVGSDNSSATQGSSMASVAGKNRAPTKQWAKEAEKVRGTNRSASAHARNKPRRANMAILHWTRDKPKGPPRPRRLSGHTSNGGARDWLDLLCGTETTPATAGNGRTCPVDCGAPVAFAGGGGSAAVSIRQPMQHESAQALPLSWSPLGDGSSAISVWQVTVPGVLDSAAAAWPAPKFAIMPERAIASAAASV